MQRRHCERVNCAYARPWGPLIAAGFSIDLKSGEAELEAKARDLLQISGEQPVTLATFAASVVVQDQTSVDAALLEAIETGLSRRIEFRVVKPDGGIRWLACHAERQDEDGTAALVGLVQDISEQKNREEYVKVLAREVNHRAKNLLTVVQSVARQTARSTPDEFLARFDERMQSLARSHNLLIDNEWGSVPIWALTAAELGPFSNLLDTRIVIEGSPITINADATKALGMVIHELVTNAAKYGALSIDRGRIHISWHIGDAAEGQLFSMEWIETLGPKVAEPVRRGFGSFVTSKMVETLLGGNVALTYATGGLRWKFTCPASKVFEAPRKRQPR